jgi:hypothetical protein
MNNTARAIVPETAKKLVFAADIGARRIHWMAVAISPPYIVNVVDADSITVHSPLLGNLADKENVTAVETAITNALATLRDELIGGRLTDLSGCRMPDICLVDSGAWPETIYHFCKQSGADWRPSKGYGSSSRAGRFREPFRRGQAARQSPNWYFGRLTSPRIDILHFNADHYKLQAQIGLMAGADTAGAVRLWKTEPALHRQLAAHLTAECWQREFDALRGKWIEGFVQVNKQNHYLDCIAMALAGSDVLKAGIHSAPKAVPIRWSQKQEQRKTQ